jgi:4-amino-4-deoxy-L-arabinose transferase-like glycosyltransferase
MVTRLYIALNAQTDRWLEPLNAAAIRQWVGSCTTTWKPYALLIGVCALLFLPGIASLPPIDRDEPRYMQASRQMIESGDYNRIYFQKEFRNRKPVGIYWLQAGTVNLLGGKQLKDEVWPYRLPSLICAVGSILLMFRLGAHLFGKSQALLAALLFAVTPLMIAVAHAATTDSALLFFTTLAQYNLLQIYRANRTSRRPRIGNAFFFWIALGAGMLIKGPISPLIALLTASSLMVLDRNRHAFKGIHAWWGIPLLLAIVLPWLISIQAATDGAFLRESLGGDFGKKLISGQESHGSPPGYYTLLMAVTCWPVSLLAIPALLNAWRNRRSDPGAAMCLCWIAPYLLVLECVPTKLPHYILSAYPPLVLLCIHFAWNDVPIVLPNTFWRILDRIYRFVWILVLPLIVIALAASSWIAATPAIPALITGALAIGGFLVYRLRRKEALCLLTGCGSLLILVAPLFFGIIAPDLTPLWISRSAAVAFDQVRRVQPDSRLYSVGYREPSLVFLTQTDINLCQSSAIETGYRPEMVALIPEETAKKLSVPLVKITSIHGLNYSNGKVLNLGLYVPPESSYVAESAP